MEWMKWVDALFLKHSEYWYKYKRKTRKDSAIKLNGGATSTIYKLNLVERDSVSLQ